MESGKRKIASFLPVNPDPFTKAGYRKKIYCSQQGKGYKVLGISVK